MDWDKLRVFHLVASEGSFTNAARTLNINQSAVSRQISTLEETIKVPLFNRHPRGINLTEQGKLLFATTSEIYGRLAETEAKITENLEQPMGSLRVAATISFGSVWLTPLIGSFVERYPDIQLSLLLSDTDPGLSMRRADVAICMTSPRHGNLIQRHLFSLRFSICASRNYLARFGIPKDIQDINQHHIITYGDESHAPENINWLISAGLKPDQSRRPALEVNNIFAMFLAVRASLGIAFLPDYLLHGQQDIVVILPELRGPKFEAYFAYPEELRHSRKVAVFRDFLLEKIAEQSNL